MIKLKTNDWDEHRKKNPLTCQLCGKTDSTVDAFVGGFIGHAHLKCAEIAAKGVELYLRYLTISPRGIIWFAQELLNADHEKQFVITPQGENHE